MSDNEEIIQDHRKMLMMTGKISDFQKTQLERWPFLIFDREDVKSVSVKYNFLKKEKRC